MSRTFSSARLKNLLRVMRSNPANDSGDGIPFADLAEAFVETGEIALMQMLNALEESGDVMRVSGTAVHQRRYVTLQ